MPLRCGWAAQHRVQAIKLTQNCEPWGDWEMTGSWKTTESPKDPPRGKIQLYRDGKWFLFTDSVKSCRDRKKRWFGDFVSFVLLCSKSGGNFLMCLSKLIYSWSEDEVKYVLSFLGLVWLFPDTCCALWLPHQHTPTNPTAPNFVPKLENYCRLGSVA